MKNVTIHHVEKDIAYNNFYLGKTYKVTFFMVSLIDAPISKLMYALQN